MTTLKPEPCTTCAARKKHYSVDLAPRRWGNPGRDGATLCGQNAYDQTATNDRYEWRTRKPDIDRMPECKLCARATERIEAGKP